MATITSRRALPLLVALFACSGRTAAPLLPPGSSRSALIIEDVYVVDVSRGAIQEDRTVLVVDGVIRSIELMNGPRSDSAVAVHDAGNARRIDGEGGYLIPALFDGHIHLDILGFEEALPLLAAHGVLGVRDMGGDLERIRALEHVSPGAGLPPLRIVTPGLILDGPTDDWPYRITVTDSAEAGEAVRAQVARGVDFIKVHQNLSAEAYFAIAAAAKEVAVPFSGHVPAQVDGLDAARAGQATIEHLSGMPWCDAEGCAGTADALGVMLEEGTRLTPTLSVYDAYARAARGTTVLLGQERFVSERILSNWALQDSINEQFLPPPEERVALTQGILDGAMRAAGVVASSEVPVIAGTDAGFVGVLPGFSLHRELGLLVEAGFTEAQALRAATLEPARLLGIADSVGTVEVGRRADLVLLRDNPLEDIGALSTLQWVIGAGHPVARADLERLLAEAGTSLQGSAPAADHHQHLASLEMRLRDGEIAAPQRLYFDLAAVVAPPEAGEAAAGPGRSPEEMNERLAARIRALGLDRVLFGSDWNSVDPVAYLATLRQHLPLSAQKLERVLQNRAPYVP